MAEAVKVVVRCRPFNEREKANTSDRCITINSDANEVLLKSRDDEPEKSFSYDAVFDSEYVSICYLNTNFSLGQLSQTFMKKLHVQLLIVV
jgi:hypothetical protein